jgi:hypothetical protein
VKAPTVAQPVDRSGPLRLPDGLTVSTRKRELYAVDTYFRECWDDLLDAWGDSAVARVRRLACVVFKPDAIVGRRVLPAMEFLVERGFRPVGCTTFRYSRHTIREAWRYQFNVASRERIAIVDILLPSTESLFVLVEYAPPNSSLSASEHLTALKGSTRRAEQRADELRARLCSTAPLLNFVHTGDEPADVVRELGVYFDASQRCPIIRDVESSEDRYPQVQTVIRDLYRRIAAHDLDLAASVSRIENACRLHNESGKSEALAHQAIMDDCMRIRNHGEVDWQRLFRRFDAVGLEIEQWDKIVVATELTRCDIPGAEPVL